MRILAVDLGDARIGLAMSDINRILVKPFGIIKHTSRMENAKKIVNIARDNECDLIVISLPLDSKGEYGYRARKSLRFVEAIKSISDINTILWDETDTSKNASKLQIEMGLSQKKRKQPIDDLAAAILLNDYLQSVESYTEKKQ